MTADEMLSTLALALALLEARRRARPDVWDLLRPEPKQESR